MRNRTAYLVSAAAGATTWVGLSVYSGTYEGWDTDLYFIFGLPALYLTTGVLGYLHPVHPWRWALAVFGTQAAISFVRSLDSAFLILGIATFIVLTIPSIATGYLGAFIGRRVARRKKSPQPVFEPNCADLRRR